MKEVKDERDTCHGYFGETPVQVVTLTPCQRDEMRRDQAGVIPRRDVNTASFTLPTSVWCKNTWKTTEHFFSFFFLSFGVLLVFHLFGSSLFALGGPYQALIKRLTAFIRSFKATDPASSGSPYFPEPPFFLSFLSSRRTSNGLQERSWFLSSSSPLGSLPFFCLYLFQAAINFTALIRVCSGADCSF